VYFKDEKKKKTQPKS